VGAALLEAMPYCSLRVIVPGAGKGGAGDGGDGVGCGFIDKSAEIGSTYELCLHICSAPL